MISIVNCLSKRGGRMTAVALVLAGLVLGPTAIASDRDHDGRWVATWTASPQPASSPLVIDDQTLRQVVHVSSGGRRVRVRLSNASGGSDVFVGAAHVALHGGGASIVGGSDRVLTFSGSATTTIPAGTLVVSDPVTLDVPALGDLAVSIYLPGQVAATTRHDIGLQTNYLSTPGDFTGATDFTGTTTQSFHFLTAVEVRAPARAGGDCDARRLGDRSIRVDAWHESALAQSVGGATTGGEGSDMAVLNAGMSGNRILHDIVGPGSLSRLDRDALCKPERLHLIVSQGNNDILIPDLIGIPAQNVSAEQIIQGHQQIITLARAMGLRVYGATLFPSKAFPFPASGRR